MPLELLCSHIGMQSNHMPWLFICHRRCFAEDHRTSGQSYTRSTGVNYYTSVGLTGKLLIAYNLRSQSIYKIVHR